MLKFAQEKEAEKLPGTESYFKYLQSPKEEWKKHSPEIRHFFSSQYFADGLRITIKILLPALILSYFGQLEAGFTISLGALCVSITDSPGPVVHKRNGMFYCTIFLFIVALVTGYARMHRSTMLLEIAAFSFLFSMFMVYGARAGAVGSASLLVMILMIDKPLQHHEVLTYSALVAAGGAWYMLASMLSAQIMPYRPAQRALGECIHEVARFLHIKASFYNIDTLLEEDYQNIVKQQVVVNEKQDAVRELYFKSRLIVKETTSTGRILILTFTEVVDLFEDIMGTFYDYTAIRENFGKTGVLHTISGIIKNLATELDNIGFAIQANITYKKQAHIEESLEMLRQQIDEIGRENNGMSTLVLKKVLVNLRNLNHRIDYILQYFSAKSTKRVNNTGKLDYSRFISSQRFSIKVLRENLTFSSAIFRHALRMAIVCSFGFVVAKLIAYGHHSYWILLTSAFILKPAFSLTKQRNIQRITGTIAGGLIGIIILLLVTNKIALFIILLFFMIGSYSFQRLNYIVMVIFVTPYVLILFKFLGLGVLQIAEERVIDTLIGCAIAFSASYLLFPSWESDQVKTYMQKVLKANIAFLKILAEILVGKNISITEYKLARKDVYVSSANLSAAFQRMISEPKNKQKYKTELHQFVVLNHILSSNISTIASSMILNDKKIHSAENLRPVKKTLSALNLSLSKLEPNYTKPEPETLTAENSNINEKTLSADEKMVTEQLEFIQKVSNDICKITDKLDNDE